MTNKISAADGDKGYLQVVFQCHQQPFGTESDILTYLKDCTSASDGLGLTGVLVAFNGSFVTVLEGKECAVLSRLEDIAMDRRRRRMNVLREGRVAHRRFSGWATADLRVVPEIELHAEDSEVFADKLSRGLRLVATG